MGVDTLESKSFPTCLSLSLASIRGPQRGSGRDPVMEYVPAYYINKQTITKNQGKLVPNLKCYLYLFRKLHRTIEMPVKLIRLSICRLQTLQEQSQCIRLTSIRQLMEYGIMIKLFVSKSLCILNTNITNAF